MLAGVFDEFFGVPLHPGAVHAPIVLIPLLAIVSVAVLIRPVWRRRATLPLAGLSIVMVALLFVAKESGEAAKAADNVFGDIGRHQTLGDQTFKLGVVWMVLALAAGVAALVQRRDRAATLSAAAGEVPNDRIVLVLNVLATLAVIVTTIWLIRTGHAGAESRWVI